MELQLDPQIWGLLAPRCSRLCTAWYDNCGIVCRIAAVVAPDNPDVPEFLFGACAALASATLVSDCHGLMQCRGRVEKVSMKCDVYSFGVVLWELVTTESPRFGQAWYRPPR